MTSERQHLARFTARFRHFLATISRAVSAHDTRRNELDNAMHELSLAFYSLMAVKDAQLGLVVPFLCLENAARRAITTYDQSGAGHDTLDYALCALRDAAECASAVIRAGD